MRYKLKKDLVIIPPSIFVKKGTICWMIGVMAETKWDKGKTMLCISIDGKKEAYQYDITRLHNEDWENEFFTKIPSSKVPPIEVVKAMAKRGKFVEGEDFKTGSHSITQRTWGGVLTK